MSEKKSLLLQPIQIGSLTLKNRIMFPPLTTCLLYTSDAADER